MYPTEKRLLAGIRAAIAPLAEAGRPDEDQRVAAGIALALDELELRQDEAFFAEARREAEGILEAASALTGKTPAAPAAPWSMNGAALQLEQAVRDLSRGGVDPASARPLLDRIVDWENLLHKRRGNPPRAAATPESGVTVDAAALRDYLARHFLERDVTITHLRQLVGGFSKLTVLFDAEYGGMRKSYVLRGEQPRNLLLLEGTDIRNEYHVLHYVRRGGLPVPEPLWLEEDASRLGARFLISDKAQGRNFGSRVDVRETISPALLRELIGKLVAIHTLPVDADDADVAASHLSGWARHKTLTECVAAQIAFWRARSADFGLPPSPILVRALDWLEANVPHDDAAPSLVHGDYGLHNLLITDDDKISCILDWEAAGIGDPADEMAWLTAGLAASFPPADVVALYHELGGPRLSEERLRYFEVMNAVRFEVTCGRALHLFEADPAVGLDALQLGLLYMQHGTGGLNAAIERAEAARKA